MAKIPRFTTSSAFADGLPYEAVVQELTGCDIALHVGAWLQAAGLDAHTAGELEGRILRSHFDSTRAAFAAGVAVGLDPRRVLLEELRECERGVKRCHAALDQVEAVTR